MKSKSKKSPFFNKEDKKEMLFDRKVKKMFEDEKVDAVLFTYFKNGKSHIQFCNLCGHDLHEISEMIEGWSEEE